MLYRALHDGRPVFWCWRALAILLILLLKLRNQRMRFIAFLSFFEHAIAKALFRVYFDVAGSSLTGRAFTLRNGRRHYSRPEREFPALLGLEQKKNPNKKSR